MRLLLDTHAFLWFVTGDRRLSARALRAISCSHPDMRIPGIDAPCEQEPASTAIRAIEARLTAARCPRR